MTLVGKLVGPVQHDTLMRYDLVYGVGWWRRWTCTRPYACGYYPDCEVTEFPLGQGV